MSRATDPLLASAAALAAVWAGALTGFGEHVGEHPDAVSGSGVRGAFGERRESGRSGSPGTSGSSGARGMPGAFGATTDDASAAVVVAPAQLDVESMSDAGVLRALEAVFDHKRQVEALAVRLAAEVAQRSRPSLGQGGLAKSSGHTSAVALITEVARVTSAEAGKYVRLGEATTAPLSLLGERLPPKFPLVADAVNAAAVPVDAALAIVTALGQAAPRAVPEHLVAAEVALVEFAVGHSADVVRKLSIWWRDALDEDGIAPREEELIAARSLKWSKLRNGLERCTIDLDPLGAGYLRTAVDALVGDALREVRFEADGGHGDVGGQGRGTGCGSNHGHDGRDRHDAACGNPDRDGCGAHHTELPDQRTIPRIAADALVDMAKHMMGCTTGPGTLPHTTLVIRMTLEQLQSGLGAALLDGVEEPITAGAARRLAADAELIPAVLGGNSEVLDLGIGRRLFSRAQRIAFAERDGGCAVTGCGRPPSYTEAHHLQWWSHGGKTDLDNGILLCTAHHHIIHTGWNVQVIDNVPWFTPPARIDPARTPRRGGRLPTPQPT